MSEVTSRDGTTIAFDRLGEGPAVVLVDGALSHRALGPTARLADPLAADLTVIRYDRRGRGESGDTAPYDTAREVEDLEAVIAEAGGPASVVGLSSGAALALEAAASGLAMTKLALYEPPFDADSAEPDEAYVQRLNELIAAGRNGDAVEWFLERAAKATAAAIPGAQHRILENQAWGRGRPRGARPHAEGVPGVEGGRYAVRLRDARPHRIRRQRL
ncbi:MAG: alpha/beta fold hydrolase [Solirubrobacteraceae bacterium]